MPESRLYCLRLEPVLKQSALKEVDPHAFCNMPFTFEYLSRCPVLLRATTGLTCLTRKLVLMAARVQRWPRHLLCLCLLILKCDLFYYKLFSFYFFVIMHSVLFNGFLSARDVIG